MTIITISSQAFPDPDKGGKLTVVASVSQGENALGEFVGQEVGRGQYRFGSLRWKLLDIKTWSDMLKEFEKFVVVARVPDTVNNNWIAIRIHPRNRATEPVEFDADGLPALHQNCEVNIVDCGMTG